MYKTVKKFTTEPPKANVQQKQGRFEPVEILANAKAAYKEKKFEKVLELTQQIEKINGFQFESKTLQGNAYRQLNKPDLALTKYIESLDYTSKKAIVYEFMAMSYYDQKNYEESEKLFQKAIDNDPEDFKLRENLGTFYYNQKAFDKAEKLFLEMLKIQDNYAEAHKRVGIIYQAQGKKDLAIQHLERYLQLRPKAGNAPEVQALIQKLKSS